MGSRRIAIAMANWACPDSLHLSHTHFYPHYCTHSIKVNKTFILPLSGEKKIEKENHGKNCYHTEISYGSFKRVIPLPEGVDTNKAEATFKKGVLNVVLPKTPQAQSVEKKLTIKAE